MYSTLCIVVFDTRLPNPVEKRAITFRTRSSPLVKYCSVRLMVKREHPLPVVATVYCKILHCSVTQLRNW